MANKEKYEQISVNPDLHLKLKVYVAKHKTNMKEVVDSLIENYLIEKGEIDGSGRKD